MQIKVSSSEKGDAQVTIQGRPVPFVNAAILINPNQEQTELVVTLQCFLNNTGVSSNIDEYTTSIANDPEVRPSELMAQCNDAIVALISKDGYGVEVINPN